MGRAARRQANRRLRRGLENEPGALTDDAQAREQVVGHRLGDRPEERAADGVKLAVVRRDPPETALQHLDRAIEADVALLGRLHRPPVARDHPPPAHTAHAQVDKVRDERLDRTRVQDGVGIGEDEHIARRRGGRAIERLGLADVLLRCQHHEPRVLEAPQDRFGVVGRAVGEHDDLQPVRRVVQAQRVADLLLDARAGVAHRDDHADRGHFGLGAWLPLRAMAHSGPQHHRVAHEAGEPKQAQREDAQVDRD